MGITQRLGTIPLAISTDTSNNVGIGGSPSGSYKLEVTGSGRYLSGNEALRLDTTSTAFDTSIRFYNNNSATYWGGIQAGPGAISGGGMNIYNNGAYPMAFNVNGAERMRITSAGNFGIGNTTAIHKLQVGSNADTNTSIGKSILYLSGNAGNVGYVNEIGFGDVSETNPQSAIGNIITNATASSYGDLYFATRNVTTNTAPTERMRITSGGQVSIGSSTDVGRRLYVVGQGSTSATVNTTFDNSVGTTILSLRNDGLVFMPVVYNNTGGGSGTIAISGSGELYRATSSLKYKENVTDYNKGLAEVLQLRPVYYNVKREDDNNLYAGLIAEEIEDLGLTEFVQYAEDGSPDAIYYANMISLMTKAIQELSAQNQDLKSRLDKAGL